MLKNIESYLGDEAELAARYFRTEGGSMYYFDPSRIAGLDVAPCDNSPGTKTFRVLTIHYGGGDKIDIGIVCPTSNHNEIMRRIADKIAWDSDQAALLASSDARYAKAPSRPS